MQPPSDPEIIRTNPKKYYIAWNHDVPASLYHLYNRRRIRIKVYDNINRYSGQEREEYAEERRKVWAYKLTKLNYNPFYDQLKELSEVKQIEHKAEKIIQVKEQLSPTDKRKQVAIAQACDLWVESRKERTKNNNSISTYRVTASWFKKHFEALKLSSLPISKLRKLYITNALMAVKTAKGWEPTTFNNEADTLTNLFNWLEDEEYINVNPIRGKIKRSKPKSISINGLIKKPKSAL